MSALVITTIFLIRMSSTQAISGDIFGPLTQLLAIYECHSIYHLGDESTAQLDSLFLDRNEWAVYSTPERLIKTRLDDTACITSFQCDMLMRMEIKNWRKRPHRINLSLGKNLTNDCLRRSVSMQNPLNYDSPPMTILSKVTPGRATYICFNITHNVFIF